MDAAVHAARGASEVSLEALRWTTVCMENTAYKLNIVILLSLNLMCRVPDCWLRRDSLAMVYV